MNTQKTTFIRIGDFFFKYRNAVFPLLWVALFLSFTPAEGFLTLPVILACGLVALGLFLRAAIIGFAYIKRGGLNKKVHADTLVTEGFFNICRNPLYVGNMLIYCGVFLMHGHPVVILFGIGGTFFIYQSIIAAEEYFLRNKFGENYDTYCHEVPRWGMKLGRVRAATSGMRFNFKRVLMKDYSTIANSLITLIFIQALRHYKYDQPDMQQHSLAWNIAAIVAIVLIAFGISRAKKMKLLTL
ncbi:MAG: methyltransferase family protein [Rickettsiales bacterium]